MDLEVLVSASILVGLLTFATVLAFVAADEAGDEVTRDQALRGARALAAVTVVAVVFVVAYFVSSWGVR